MLKQRGRSEVTNQPLPVSHDWLLISLILSHHPHILIIMKPTPRTIPLSLFLSVLLALSQANTREPDPGAEADTLCFAEVLKIAAEMVPDSSLLDDTVPGWPEGSCCTTTDCELQHLSCPMNPAHAEDGGDMCCYKESGDGAEAGTCMCGIDQQPQGTCF